MKEELEKYYAIIRAAHKQINAASKEIQKIQDKCPHLNQEHHRQEYVGRWSDCKDCGKQEV